MQFVAQLEIVAKNNVALGATVFRIFPFSLILSLDLRFRQEFLKVNKMDFIN
jgi:hypothetical protein